jgi:hypothetical protein
MLGSEILLNDTPRRKPLNRSADFSRQRRKARVGRQLTELGVAGSGLMESDARFSDARS